MASAAVAQCAAALEASESAIAGRPADAAVSAAPTVPECRMACPMFGPRLMPASTMSGRSPKAACEPAKAIMAGDACTANVGTSSSPSSLRFSTSSLPPSASPVRAAPLPLRSPSGAAMVRSSPAPAAARASVRSPALSIPSSLVISARIGS